MGGQGERAGDLGDRVNGHPEAVESALPELEAILRSPQDADALVAAIESLGHAWNSRAASVLLRFVDVNHSDATVRCALARALPGGSGEEPELSAAVDVLVRLSTDAAAEVRDWACFGLGQLAADTVVVRDALAARLGDEDEDTRAEAVMALAELSDPRALPACAEALAVQPELIDLLTLQAAAVLADPSLLPSLTRLQAARDGDAPNNHSTALNEALLRCQATGH